jgi:hypothetical protein
MMDRAQNLGTVCVIPGDGTVWLSTMNVSDVMTKKPVTISPDATLREAYIMKEFTPQRTHWAKNAGRDDRG